MNKFKVTYVATGDGKTYAIPPRDTWYTGCGPEDFEPALFDSIAEAQEFIEDVVEPEFKTFGTGAAMLASLRIVPTDGRAAA